MGYCGGVPVEDMQALAITSLSAADVAKQYEHIRELGKGTYGKVDLVVHRTQGELVQKLFQPPFPSPNESSVKTEIYDSRLL